MKLVSANEIFQNKNVNYGKAIYSSKISGEAVIRKTIAENHYILHALLEEYAFIQEAKLNSLCNNSVSLNYSFFFDNGQSYAELKEKLQTVYSTINPIINESNNIIGFYALGTNPLAIDIAREFYDTGKAESYIYRFLSFGETNISINSNIISVMLEKTNLSNEENASLLKSDFYKLIKKNLCAIGLACFITNCMSVNELENDEYIQALLSMGHNVYVYSSSSDYLIKRIIVN